jgi:hypothetical protein
MRTIFRVILTIVVFIGSYCFIYWVPVSFMPAARQVDVILRIGSLLIAAVTAFFLWKTTANPLGLIFHVLMGGMILGSIGFVLGFFGPLIFTPDSNQGPLIGILYTGPVGFLLGLFGGGLFWIIKVKNK